MSPQKGLALGYLRLIEEGNLFQGAALVTDFRGIPLDFRYTEPISPTRLERILYGDALDVYIREEVILESLLKAVEVKPSLWVCNDRKLLEFLKEHAACPPIFLESTSYSPLDAVGEMVPQPEAGAYLVQVDPISAPLKLIVPVSTGEDAVKSAASILIEAAASMELLEPFARIKRALEAVAAGEITE